MSKTTRQPERPHPLSWAQIADDVQSAKDNDVAFVIGRERSSSQHFHTESPSNTSQTSPNASALHDNDADTSATDPAEVKDSCDKVVRLLTLYEKLKDAPSSLQDRYQELKDLGDEMTKSIGELKSLSQSILKESESKTDTDLAKKQSPKSAKQDSASKGKSKQKKKR